MNPMLDIGQMEGAFVMGLGYYTRESQLWLPDGSNAVCLRAFCPVPCDEVCVCVPGLVVSSPDIHVCAVVTFGRLTELGSTSRPVPSMFHSSST